MLLLVNADPLFLEQAERTLTETNIRVVPAANGGLAVTAVRTLPEIKRALISGDLPDIAAADLIQKLRNARAALNIVSMNGLPFEWVLEIAKSVAPKAQPIAAHWTAMNGSGHARLHPPLP